MSPKSALALALLGTALVFGSPGQAQQPAPPAAANPLDAVPDKIPFDVPYGAPISLERAPGGDRSHRGRGEETRLEI